jgi:hypothetical protein
MVCSFRTSSVTQLGAGHAGVGKWHMIAKVSLPMRDVAGVRPHLSGVMHRQYINYNWNSLL